MFSVYVVELDPVVMEEPGFRGQNPGTIEPKGCLYVGMTGLTPEQRLANHRAGHKACRYVTRYALHLRKRLYEKLNPMTWEEAKVMEVELAARLRRKGYAVYQK